MTCEEFFEAYIMDDRNLDAMIDEMYWTDDFDSEAMFDYLKQEAKKNHVTLTDEEEWDYDKFFYTIYKETEKGLS